MNYELGAADVQWAAETARAAFARWRNQKGHYDNRLNSHFKGKLGELAVEKFLTDCNLKFDSHFRFAERENLADLVVKIKGYRQILRVDVKTWGEIYWRELGRCVAVNQLSGLKKKADAIVWCVAEIQEIPQTPAPIQLRLCGWSTLADVERAPVQLTGIDKMRKVENHQLPEESLREMASFLP
ncbi:MAG: hypothetical protein LC099_08405 [Anaerolineales bacterium]|nr:hypothetical protein [Anaerolineales bacterium]